jgi:phosphocarrier protein HPr
VKIAEIKILNKSGLHARPAARFVQLTNKFKSNIQICKSSKCVDAKNILKVLSLGVDQGDIITIKVEGPDEEEAYKSVLELLLNVLPVEDK